MDFKTILETYDCCACIISVEMNPDKTCKEILVVDGNDHYKKDIEEFAKHPFVENTPYYYSFPKDMNFEDFLYRSAILRQNLHTYVNLEQIGLWVEM